MNRNFRSKLLVAAILATTSPLVLTSTTAFAKDPPTKEERAAKAAKAKDARQDAAQARQDARQQQANANAHQREAARTGNRAERQEHMAAAQKARVDQARANERARDRQADANRIERQQAANQAARQEARQDRQMASRANQAARQENRADRQQAQVANQAARQQARSDRQTARRLSQAQQNQVIATQKSRVTSYRTWANAQRAESQRIAAAIQAQNRTSQYAYIQDYQNRWWQQQQRYATMNINYYNDPYYYTAPSYRYMRDGSWYTINSYGYELLQNAINAGYNEGYRAGRADRMDGWRFDYRGSWVYQNASFGYSGYYLDRGEYNYYFRQGFRRGYEDGYYSRYRYGAYRGGNYSILGAVLNTILAVQAYDRY